MWMQILQAAGVPIFGEQFPSNWGNSALREANPQGFYESSFRRGINATTNPDPRTGQYVSPQDVASHAVKVFIRGLCRSDLAYIGCVIGTVREWRSYCDSREELNRLDSVGKGAVLPAHLEWWVDNFSLIRDVVRRGYPCQLLAYEAVVESPSKFIPETLGWLGELDTDAAVATVNPSLHRQIGGVTPECALGLSPAHIEVFDALYDRIYRTAPLEPDFVALLNQTNRELLPEIEMHVGGADAQ